MASAIHQVLKANYLKIINLNNNLTERIYENDDIYITCSYDPEGVNLKFSRGKTNENNNSTTTTNGNFNNNNDSAMNEQESFIIELLITKKTTLTKRSNIHVINGTDEICFLKLCTSQEDKLFDEMLKRVQDVNSSVFLLRTEDSSANQYFQFYGYLSQQQNMMQDFVRTSTYQKAIHGNYSDFNGKVVLDVGAGSGILSFFAVQAGAAKVYAVEASNMAQFAQQLVAANNLSDKIDVIAGKIEEIELPQKVDIIVSEPMGYMLYNERMLETYLHAKKWLKPGGKMFPSRGDLHVAPFCDEALYMEQYNKANFWYQTSFHNVDLSSLRVAAMKEYFRQPIVDTFDIRICQAKSIRHVVDFLEANEKDLHNIDIPLEFHMLETGTVHGLAFWFDVEFVGTNANVWLSTSPTEPLTHWYQVRCLLQNPLFVKQGQILTGRVVLVANKRQSYDVTIDLQLEGTNITSHNTLDLKNPYFRYTGTAVVPPGTSTQSPSEVYWNHLDTQGTRTAVNLINGITVNGLGEVSLDMPPQQQILNTNLMTIGNQQQPNANVAQYQNMNLNIHSGCIPSTGRNSTPSYSGNNNFNIGNHTNNENSKMVDDTRMIIEQSNRMILGQNKNNLTVMAANGTQLVVTDDKVMLPANGSAYIDQPMLSAMQQMFNNSNVSAIHQNTQYQQQHSLHQHPQQQQQQHSQQQQQQHQQQQQPSSMKTIHYQQQNNPNVQLYFN